MDTGTGNSQSNQRLLRTGFSCRILEVGAKLPESCGELVNTKSRGRLGKGSLWVLVENPSSLSGLLKV